jgi:hypothetical protein
MLYALSFSQEFFWGTVPIEKMRPSPRPTSVYQAILSLDHEQWKTLARDVFNRNPEDLDVETVLDRAIETNTCSSLDPPVTVYIDEAGWFNVLVYEETQPKETP